VLNKVDVPRGASWPTWCGPELEARGLQVFEVSAVSHEGLQPLTYAMAGVVKQDREQRPLEQATRIVLRPKAVDDLGFTVEREGEGFVVRGSKPERWVLQTDFNNEEAIGYLADRLATLGVEKALAAPARCPGDEVTIGDVSFDWQPTELEQFSSGMRGVDSRLEDRSRARADERRLQKDLRRAERMGLDKDALEAELQRRPDGTHE
jgi:GTP-binding protein